VRYVKRIEWYGKRCITNVIKSLIKPESVTKEDLTSESISRILVVRQDSRIGNLVLMSPLLAALKKAFSHAELNVIISKGFEDILAENPNVDTIRLYDKKSARIMPWKYPLLIRSLRKHKYDLAIDVSDGCHFSVNNVVLTFLSGARYRLGYNRGDARSFLNLLIPVPPEDIHISDALLGIAKFIIPDITTSPITYYLSERDKIFACEWLNIHNIRKGDSFFAIHPGGKGRKQWGAKKFAALIDRIHDELQVKIVVIGGKADRDIVDDITTEAKTQFEVLQNAEIGQMAAVIDRCDTFISGDTGPMHVAAALNRPTVGIFISSNFQVYGPRHKNSRIVVNREDGTACDDVMAAIVDLRDTYMEL